MIKSDVLVNEVQQFLLHRHRTGEHGGFSYADAEELRDLVAKLEKEAEEHGRREENEACAKVAEDGAFCNCAKNTINPCISCHRKVEAFAIAKEIHARMEEK